MTTQRTVRSIQIGKLVQAKEIDVSKYRHAPYPVARLIGIVTGMSEKVREDGSGVYKVGEGNFACQLLSGEVVRSSLMILPEPLVGGIALQLADETNEAGEVVKKGASRVSLAYDVNMEFNDGKGVPYTFSYSPLIEPEALGQVDPLAEIMAKLSNRPAIAAPVPEAEVAALADQTKAKGKK